MKGFKIPGKDTTEIKIGQYADDTTLFVRNEASVTECLNTVKYFGLFSGLCLNLNKTEGLWIEKKIKRKETLEVFNGLTNQ